MPKQETIGTCRLCLARGSLRNSHIMPSWAYKRILDDGQDSKQPVRMSDGLAVKTNAQFKEHLLCGDCEQVFSRWENAVSQLVVQGDGTFPWLAALPHSVPGKPADSSGLDTDTITRFAASVLWRASVAKTVPEVSLGPTYDEAFRLFLQGKADFPSSASLIVSLFTPAPPGASRIDRSFIMPASKRLERCHTHWFHLCGVRFFFYVGGEIARFIQDCSFNRLKEVAVDDGEGLRDLMRESVATSKTKGALAREAS